MSKSDVAQLLQRIATEYEAAERGLTAYAEVSRHDFISARNDNIAACHQQLSTLVGNEQATELVAKTIWPGT